MNTAVVVKYIEQDNSKGSVKISYINPDATKATNALLKQLGQDLIALTTSTYDGVAKVETTDID